MGVASHLAASGFGMEVGMLRLRREDLRSSRLRSAHDRGRAGCDGKMIADGGRGPSRGDGFGIWDEGRDASTALEDLRSSWLRPA